VPPLAADVGRVVCFISDPADEGADVLFQAGQFNDGPFPQLCDALARSTAPIRARAGACPG
jgi:hypothetical protein